MSKLDMESSMRFIPTNRASTGNAETMSAVEKLRDPPRCRPGGDGEAT